MTPLEKEIRMRMLQQEYGGKATVANLADAGGAALGFVDNGLTPVATKMQNALVQGLTKIDPGASTAQFGNWMAPKAKVLQMAASPAALNALKVATGLGAVGGVLGAARRYYFWRCYCR